MYQLANMRSVVPLQSHGVSCWWLPLDINVYPPSIMYAGGTECQQAALQEGLLNLQAGCHTLCSRNQLARCNQQV